MTESRKKGTQYTRSGKRGSGRKNYRRARALKKVLSAVLLVLMVLAFIVIQRQEYPGASQASGSGHMQETAEPSGSAKKPEGDEADKPAQDLSGQQASVQPQVPEEVPEQSRAQDFTPDMAPPYSGQAYADINGDVPFFTEEEMTSEAFHEYWPLDELGRCTGAYACVGPETLPKQRRGDISSVKPTGWNTNRYDDIDGEILFNRCHLIGHMLTGQDANERNLITGTRYMNTEGMLPFEESVLMYVEGTGHHVMYRVRPFFAGDNLVCSGVLMEARSVEDPLVQFCAFCYNVQPGFEIDYATGDNRRAKEGQGGELQRIIEDPEASEEPASRQAGAAGTAEAAEAEEEITYILNTNTHKFHMPYCDSVKDIKDKNRQETTLDRDSLISEGYSPCKRCNP